VGGSGHRNADRGWRTQGVCPRALEAAGEAHDRLHALTLARRHVDEPAST